ncbi:MAG: HDOD domain-containing protein [Proteobacteria bacterium]|nr:HDOD domain-containing protein [Pseudomonadota bacterium]MBU1687055.1 HDOD domain-containing protein [Pseudomonadota bacterium]
MDQVLPINEERFRRIQRFIDRMPSLSTTVTKVLSVCNQPSTSPSDLNRVVSLDPVLTGQVLKLINSAYYSLPNQITSLTRAIIMLGLNTVKNLALSTAILTSFSRADSFRSLDMDDFWTHSLCVGVTAKNLASRLGVPVVQWEEYFVAGLLHDLGKIPLNDCFDDQYGQVLELARLDQGSLARAEKMIIGLDHGLVGTLIAAKWKLSDAMTEVMGHHHDSENSSEEHRPLVAVVSLANLFANLYAYGDAGDTFQEESVVGSLLDQVGISWSELWPLVEIVGVEIRKARIFLQVTKGK